MRRPAMKLPAMSANTSAKLAGEMPYSPMKTTDDELM